MDHPFLSLTDVSKRFVIRIDAASKIANLFGAGYRDKVVRAVDEVSLSVDRGKVLGLVGESGCGKSTLGRMIAGVLEPSSGTIRLDGRAVGDLRGRARREAELSIQMIFQDPAASLNPRMRIVDLIGEAPWVHGIVRREDVEAYVCETLERVGFNPAMRQRYPHQFSGGQRARIGIARALAVNPKVLVCDESTAALDVSIQAHVLNLFMKLREELGLTYVFVSHDLGIIQHIADDVAVMYLGRIVESGSVAEVFDNPNHPYTRALIAEIPRLEARNRKFASLKGELPSPLHPLSGCPFHPRCPSAMARCSIERPALREVAAGHLSACHLNSL